MLIRNVKVNKMMKFIYSSLIRKYLISEKNWTSQFKRKVDTNVQINGPTDNQSVTNCFGNHIAFVYINSADDLDAINEVNVSYTKLPKDNQITNLNSHFSEEIVEKCVKLLK